MFDNPLGHLVTDTQQGEWQRAEIPCPFCESDLFKRETSSGNVGRIVRVERVDRGTKAIWAEATLVPPDGGDSSLLP